MKQVKKNGHLPAASIQTNIIRNPKIVGGMSIIEGTRITVVGILTALSEGKSINQIVADLHYSGYKQITNQHIVTAIDYANGSIA